MSIESQTAILALLLALRKHGIRLKFSRHELKLRLGHIRIRVGW